MAQGFSSPPDPVRFNARVWEIVRSIPPGKVSTYGQIAARITIPIGLTEGDYKASSPRWVGGAMAACPPDVPWHRVVNSQGKISVRGSAEEEQRNLLEEEGVEFDSRGRIDLRVFGWSGSER